jgi:hypothetical protein
MGAEFVKINSKITMHGRCQAVTVAYEIYEILKHLPSRCTKHCLATGLTGTACWAEPALQPETARTAFPLKRREG